MSDERFASVWDAIDDTPAAAENLKLRSALMIGFKEQIERQGWTQGKAPARANGLTRRDAGPSRLSIASAPRLLVIPVRPRTRTEIGARL
jgi:hypothetical protein